jgi:uncharacterized short protein YbdD (DUF466 family)
MYYGMPLHVLRELGMSFMNLQKYVKQFKKYRKLMIGLNDRFPDATIEEMQNENGEMNGALQAHIDFHHHYCSFMLSLRLLPYMSKQSVSFVEML